MMRFKLIPLNKLIILVLSNVSLVNSYTIFPQDSQTQVCKTAVCTKAAQYILKNMDENIHPCENFYQFACGKFIKETVIPNDQSKVSIFTQETDALQMKLKQSIEQDIKQDDPKILKLLKSYYEVCLDTEKIEKKSIVDLKNILIKLGNWPILSGKAWNETNFDWKRIIYKLRRIGFTSSINSIIKFGIKIDEKNTKKHIVSLGQAALMIKHEYLSKGKKNDVVQAYYKFMVEVAKILGADDKQARKELAKSLNFEINLAKISLAQVDFRNKTQLYNVKTVKQLQSEFPYIPWKKYLNQLLSPQSHIGLSDEVIVDVPSFFKSLSELLSKSPKRVLANYIFWRVVLESSTYLNERVRRAIIKFKASVLGIDAQKPRWAQCINNALKNLPVATGVLYVRKNFDKKTKRDAKALVNNLRESFENILKTSDWMDEETKKAALVKLKATQASVAYPDEFLNNAKLDRHFKSLKFNSDSYLKNNLKLKLFNFGNTMATLRKSVNRMHWISSEYVTTVNGYYSRTKNLITIPAGILQGPFFERTRPSYMNYAFVGWVISHELTHGFDDEGSQNDEHGNLANWWNTKTRHEYLKRAQCIIDQYSNYTVEEVGLNINGKISQGENIADNGGIKEAYFAYENYEKENGKELRLPGLPYSPRQMFWISAANLWCSKYRPEALKNRILTDVHSPAEFRVIGSFSNMPQFARDFKCPLGSPMNPVKKCTVW